MLLATCRKNAEGKLDNHFYEYRKDDPTRDNFPNFSDEEHSFAEYTDSRREAALSQGDERAHSYDWGLWKALGYKGGAGDQDVEEMLHDRLATSSGDDKKLWEFLAQVQADGKLLIRWHPPGTMTSLAQQLEQLEPGNENLDTSSEDSLIRCALLAFLGLTTAYYLWRRLRSS